MGYQEVIESLRIEGGIEITGKSRRVAEFLCGLDVAVSAMQKLQKIKADIDLPNGKMTLDEAITHAREVAQEKYIEGMLCHANTNDKELDGCVECAREHEQLAEWLELLKQYCMLGTLEEVGEALEKAEKYHWHNLRKNPDDLPKESGDYIVWYQSINNAYNGAKVMFYSARTGWVIGRARKEEGIIAWRKIKQFECEVKE